MDVYPNQVEVASANFERARDIGGAVPPALLSYNDITAMKPGSKGRHNLSNKEWGNLIEEARQWFICIRMSGIPQTNQTHLIKAILNQTLVSRGMMNLKEKHHLHTFSVLQTSLVKRASRETRSSTHEWYRLSQKIQVGIRQARLEARLEAVCRASMRDIQSP